MISLKYIRENKDNIINTLKAKKVDFDLEKLLESDKNWRKCLKKSEDLKSIRNTVSKEIAQLKSQGKNCQDKIEHMRKVSEEIKEVDPPVEKEG